MTEQEKQERIKALRTTFSQLKAIIEDYKREADVALTELVNLSARYKKGDRVNVREKWIGVVEGVRNHAWSSNVNNLCLVYSVRLVKKDGSLGLNARDCNEDDICLADTPISESDQS